MEKLLQDVILARQVQFLNGFSIIKVSSPAQEVPSIRLITQMEEQVVLMKLRFALRLDSTGSLESSMFTILQIS
jgi:uncharacterized protein YehS (DUF1456 family)